jgi:peptide chain release factor 1
MNFADALTDYQSQLKELELAIVAPETLADRKKIETVNREYQRVKKIVDLGTKVVSLQNALESAKESLSDNDPEMQELAKEEIAEIEAKLPDAEEQFTLALIPPDPMDDNDAIIEIRAGAGGDEAAHFAGNLFRMYSKFAEANKRRVTIVSQSLNDLGGVKEIIFELSGDGAYGDMKYESGVHRVQRVPETEKQGRIHTSTATVAVLPKVEEEDFHIDMKDLTIEATTSTGAGGQSVNTTYSAIRIVHLPTSIMVYCQEERSQRQNKERALEVIRARVYAHEQEKKQKEEREQRQSQIGTGDRSEKIRTYNVPQDRVTDHRIKESWHNLPGILEGEIAEIITQLKLADRQLPAS